MLHPPFPANQQGFSLVELSIVLVILGLLVGGVLTGQSLIRAAQLRGITTQVDQYAAASKSFRDKYLYLPGDLPNATSFWPVNPSGCPSGGGTVGTCNGDGDGGIDYISLVAVTNRGCEASEVWKHLSFAGLISGSYSTQTAASCYGLLALGTTLPQSKLSDAYWEVIRLPEPLTGSGSGSTAQTFFAGTGGNVLALGGGSSANYWNISPSSLKAEEAWNIDTKMDDGKPSTGKVTVPRDDGVGGANCVNEAATGGPAFELTLSSSRCTMLFMNIF